MLKVPSVGCSSLPRTNVVQSRGRACDEEVVPDSLTRLVGPADLDQVPDELTRLVGYARDFQLVSVANQGSILGAPVADPGQGVVGENTSSPALKKLLDSHSVDHPARPWITPGGDCRANPLGSGLALALGNLPMGALLTIGLGLQSPLQGTPIAVVTKPAMTEPEGVGMEFNLADYRQPRVLRASW